MADKNLVVLKFGGTSVSTRARWETIESIADSYLARGERPFIVCSAVSGVSNLLESLLSHALVSEHADLLVQIHDKHAALARSLGVDMMALIGEELALIERLAHGASLTQEVSPRLQASVMACGELMSTRLGVAFLNRPESKLTGRVAWSDARERLRARSDGSQHMSRHYLSAVCDHEPDEVMQQELAGLPTDVVVTQGFIARDDQDHTVLLGRGGSDTSAAYFASVLGAVRLEIWTDVPGMFTANPRQVPSARLLRKLSYSEAQELASMGAKVLHPRCLAPVRQHNIPLHIRCTQLPEMDGTIVSAETANVSAQVKAISTKGGIPLVSMETLGMWQQVGFLADIFQTFKRQGLSIDQVTTSETNVTVSLDPVANALDSRAMDTLMEDLGEFCQARRIGPCAAVSLVGHHIRAILHKLGPMLEVFEQQQIYMMSQSSSDLNITFVVAEAQAERLVRELHAMIFGDVVPDELIGPTWREIFEDEPGHNASQVAIEPWWIARREELVELATSQPGAVYAYSRDRLHASATALESLTAIDHVHYAIKANSNPEVLRIFDERGLNFECVSPGEIDRVMEATSRVDAKGVLFTPNFAPIEEYAYGLRSGAQVTLDNLHPLRHHPELFRGKELFLRLDPGLGKGHHKHVKTAGPQSKFGLSVEEVDEAIALTSAIGARITGLHVHVGSGILRSPETWTENALFLARQADRLEHVRVLDLGGGMGVPEKPGDLPLNLDLVNRDLEKFRGLHGDRFELWIEPGRYCVAEAGVLLARVTQIKRKGDHAYIGIETGMNSLIRPSLYGAFHQIVNLSRYDEPMAWTADIVGPICESGDVLGYSRRLPVTKEGDVLMIATAGAYGFAMGSRYNLRSPAREIII